MIYSIQVLRGLAALGVAFYHTNYVINGIHTEFRGVAIFFVISGFLMPYITTSSHEGFIFGRLTRIVPLYWISTITLFALGRQNHSWSELWQSLLFIPYYDAMGAAHPVLEVGWTLNIEMFFYSVFALSLAISPRFAPLIAAALLILVRVLRATFDCNSSVCEIYANGATTYLIAGIAIFYIWNAAKLRAKQFPLAIGAITAAVLVIYITYFSGYLPTSDAAKLVLPPLLVLCALLSHSAHGGWEKLKWPIIAGNASYALYLIHPMVLGFFSNRIHISLSDNFVAMITALACTFAAAVGVFYLIERPILSIIRSFNKGSPGRTAASPNSKPRGPSG